MKVQEVIMKAVAGKLKWVEAAEILGVTDRSMRRWRERLAEHGYDGLYDYRKKQPSPKRMSVATLEKVLKLYQEKYYDFNVKHFHEKLVEEEKIACAHPETRRACCHRCAAASPAAAAVDAPSDAGPAACTTRN